MTEELYAEIMAEGRLAKTPKEREAFRAKFLARIQNQTLEEHDAEIAFFDKKFFEIKAKVEKHLEEKQAKQNAVAV
jgi:hypothetical protein